MSEPVEAPPPAPEELKMEIHKPRPWHNWREFLKEYVIIVIGVLTALAAGQAAEWWHWQGDVREARAALREEMTFNDANTFALRIADNDCIARQVGEATAILDDLEAGRPPRAFTVYRFGAGRLIVDSEWQSQRAAQTLTHFPHAELAPMSRYYDLIGDFRAWFVQEGDAWQQLGILRSPPRSGLTTADLIRLRVSLSVADRVNHLIVLNARRQIRISEGLGITGIKADPVVARNFCTMKDADFVRFTAAQQLR